MTSVKRLYIYNPNFQVPKSMWQVLMDKLPGQVIEKNYLSFFAQFTYENFSKMLIFLNEYLS